jgi:sterol desaturase/sphingolipid hydroxylase (fatty acid hydroxylase superfamily)
VTLFVILVVGLTMAGTSMGLLTWATVLESGKRHLISLDANRSASTAKIIRSVIVNSLVSLTLVFGACFGLREHLFYDRPAPLHSLVLEGLAVVLIYDFAYYFMHRYLFHEWPILRGVHSVHHAAQNPRAIDSFLLHPVENVLGLSLLLASIASVGGVHIYTFAPIFAGYTTLNVFNHAGLNVRRFPMRTLGWLAVAHDKHHHSMRSGNYASITPLPDLIFGTFE